MFRNFSSSIEKQNEKTLKGVLLFIGIRIGVWWGGANLENFPLWNAVQGRIKEFWLGGRGFASGLGPP